MKIGFITSGNIENDPRFIYVCETFIKEGHDVVFFNVYISEKQKTTNLFPYQSQAVDISLWNYIPVSFRNSYNEFFKNWVDNLAPTFAYRYLKENEDYFSDIDLFYGLELFWGGAIAYELSNLLDKKLVVDFKELYSEEGSSFAEEDIQVIKKLERDCIRKSVFLPCVSQKIIDVYEHEYGTHKFVLLENAMPFLGLDISFNREGLVKFICSAGSGGHDRGIFHLCQIWEALNPVNARLDIRLGHCTEEEKRKIKKIANNTFGKSLFLIQSVTGEKMIESLTGYDCGVIPYLAEVNRNHLYCCPNKFGQYMNAGLAIVSSNTEYITDRIRDNNLGIVYNPNDLEKSVEQFAELIEDREKLDEKRKNAYNFAQNDYVWEKSVQPLMDKFKEFV